MELTGVSGGVMLALAAALWLVYLVPSWFRRREYIATERNAVRLQQTLRILAETAEVPKTIKAEATARSVAEHERLVRLETERRHAAQRAAEAAIPKPPVSRTLRLRRTRAVTSVVLFAAIVTVLVQAVVSVLTGFSLGALVVVVVSAGTIAASMAMLNSLAAVARSQAVPVAKAAPVARRVTMSSSRTDAAPAPARWTPVAVPKPLYLAREEAPAAPARASRPAPEPSVAPNRAAAARADLERAARESERALRAAQVAPEVTPIRSREDAPAVAPAASAATQSRFARMGIVDESELQPTDIDEVLRRRRAAS
jgi:ABC-type multidrug transport system fused ATPase/permease subunit